MQKSYFIPEVIKYIFFGHKSHKLKHCSLIQYVHGAKMETSLSPLLLFILYDAVDILTKNLELIHSCHYKFDIWMKNLELSKGV